MFSAWTLSVNHTWVSFVCFLSSSFMHNNAQQQLKWNKWRFFVLCDSELEPRDGKHITESLKQPVQWKRNTAGVWGLWSLTEQIWAQFCCHRPSQKTQEVCVLWWELGPVPPSQFSIVQLSGFTNHREKRVKESWILKLWISRQHEPLSDLQPCTSVWWSHLTPQSLLCTSQDGDLTVGAGHAS